MSPMFKQVPVKEIAVIPVKKVIISRGDEVFRAELNSIRYKRVDSTDIQVVLTIDGKQARTGSPLKLYDDTPENWKMLTDAQGLNREAVRLLEMSQNLESRCTSERFESFFLKLIGRYEGSSSEHWDKYEAEKRAKGNG